MKRSVTTGIASQQPYFRSKLPAGASPAQPRQHLFMTLAHAIFIRVNTLRALRAIVLFLVMRPMADVFTSAERGQRGCSH
ncbi:MAG: hypothetical protein N3C12_04045 [Candidatus Binatia bacterium]|nr:hypothetical protein [Candidatus Binatia bacterium]